MKSKFINYCLFTILFAVWGCSHSINDSNQIHFSINPEDRKIVLPVQLNDSINANLFFDTGPQIGTLHLDLTFCSKHSSLINKSNSRTFEGGSAWSNQSTSISCYNDTTKVNIDNKEFTYNPIRVSDMKGYWGTNADGFFNIPLDDTTHVWELNFENNYLEIHSSSDFKMPKNCFVTPIIKSKNNYYPFNIQLPLEIVCNDGDTISLNHTFMIDTGMAWDIALMSSAEELNFFNKQDDAVWIGYEASYYRYYTVDARLFDRLDLDSLRIYTFHNQNRLTCSYVIGLNFLKRFNVFFDMKNMQVGFQPLKTFQRIVNPSFRRFTVSWDITSDGKFKVKEVGDYMSNPFKIAGLQKDDELITINGMTPEQINSDSTKRLPKPDSLIYEILRNGEKLSFVIHKDSNEKQGD